MFKESVKDWYAKETAKAKELKADLDAVIIRDCWYLFENEYPELSKQYWASVKIAAELKKDPAVVKKLAENPWYLRTEEMLWQVAMAKAKGSPQSLALMTW